MCFLSLSFGLPFSKLVLFVASFGLPPFAMYTLTKRSGGGMSKPGYCNDGGRKLKGLFLWLDSDDA